MSLANLPTDIQIETMTRLELLETLNAFLDAMPSVKTLLMTSFYKITKENLSPKWRDTETHAYPYAFVTARFSEEVSSVHELDSFLDCFFALHKSSPLSTQSP